MPKRGLIILLDDGPQMASKWPVIRNGLAQMMMVLPSDTWIACKFNIGSLSVRFT